MTNTSRARHLTLLVVGLLFLVVGSSVAAQRASALFQTLTADESGKYLYLAQDDKFPLWRTLGPGQSMDWHLKVGLATAPSATFALELRSEKPLVTDADLEVSVTICPYEFAHRAGEFVCPGASGVVQNQKLKEISSPTSGTNFKLPDLYAGQDRYFHVRFTLPRDAKIEDGATARIGLGLFASGTAGDGDPPGRTDLPITGADVAGPVLLAGGLVLLGVAVRGAKGRGRRLGGG